MTPKAKVRDIDELNEAIDHVRKHKQSAMIEFVQYRKTSFKKVIYNNSDGQKQFLVKNVEAVKNQYIRFAPSNYHHVDQTLQNHMGIAPSEPFGVLHWRAELQGIDYQKCAQAIIHAKHVMQNTSNIN